MPRAPAGSTQNIFYAPFDFMQRCKQREGVEISLYRYVMSHHRPGLIEMDAPVDSDDIAARCSHLTQHRRGPRAEMNHRHALPFQSLENQLDMRQHIFDIVADREAAHPTVEQLNCLRPGLDLPP